ncbi:hypothetical protein BD770DRAFT_376266 [Pilaira anomala]|nr:hypothetical protein BD770DRAFT_376266 [Pilaira anomala]
MVSLSGQSINNVFFIKSFFSVPKLFSHIFFALNFNSALYKKKTATVLFLFTCVCRHYYYIDR